MKIMSILRRLAERRQVTDAPADLLAHLAAKAAAEEADAQLGYDRAILEQEGSGDVAPAERALELLQRALARRASLDRQRAQLAAEVAADAAAAAAAAERRNREARQRAVDDGVATYLADMRRVVDAGRAFRKAVLAAGEAGRNLVERDAERRGHRSQVGEAFGGTPSIRQRLTIWLAAIMRVRTQHGMYEDLLDHRAGYGTSLHGEPDLVADELARLVSLGLADPLAPTPTPEPEKAPNPPPAPQLALATGQEAA